MKFTELPHEELARLAQDAPTKLVVMIYDEAIESLRAAATAAEEGDIMARLNGTTAAAELVSQLRLGLDLETGGDVAVSLDQLYSFIVGRLPMVNLNNDAVLANELAELLVPMHQSWLELDAEIASGAMELDMITEMPGADAPMNILPLVANAG